MALKAPQESLAAIPDHIRGMDCPVRRSGIFSVLTDDQVEELEKGRSLNEYREGQVLFYEGHHAMAAFCILTGYVKIYQSHSGKGHQILRLAGPGDFLGHETLLDRQTYEATAEAMGTCGVCVLPKSVLMPVLRDNSAVLLRLLDKINQGLNDVQHALADLRQLPVAARMAHILLDLKKRFGRQVNGATQIDLPLSRAEIADLIGTTPETAIRVLNRFQTEGMVRLTPGLIVIEQEQALMASALEREGSAEN
jgi:CRP-like cAMP-binding protein